MLKFIELPRGYKIDINNPPENLEEIVQQEFKEYTAETNEAYTDEDRLMFIDVMIKKLHRADSWEGVKDLITERYEYELCELSRLMDSDEFFNMEFMEECYERGRAHASLRYRCDDHHIYDKVNRLTARIIRAVMTWRRPPDPDPGTISIPLSEATIQEMLKYMEELNAEDRRKLFEPGNRFFLQCGDRKIEYVAQEVAG